MKQIIAILIAFFVCAGATQVSAQRSIPIKIVELPVSNNVYEVTPTDDYVMFRGTGTLDGVTLIKLPDPVPCSGRIITIINRNPKGNIKIHQFLTDIALFPIITMPIRSNIEFLSDGKAWRIYDKNFSIPNTY